MNGERKKAREQLEYSLQLISKLTSTIESFGASPELSKKTIQILLKQVVPTADDMQELQNHRVIEKNEKGYKLSERLLDFLDVIIDETDILQSNPKQKEKKLTLNYKPVKLPNGITLPTPGDWVKYAIWSEIYEPRLDIPPVSTHRYTDNNGSYTISGFDKDALKKLNDIIKNAEHDSENIMESSFIKMFVVATRFEYTKALKDKSKPSGFSNYIKNDIWQSAIEFIKKFKKVTTPQNLNVENFDKSL